MNYIRKINLLSKNQFRIILLKKVSLKIIVQYTNKIHLEKMK